MKKIPLTKEKGIKASANGVKRINELRNRASVWNMELKEALNRLFELNVTTK